MSELGNYYLDMSAEVALTRAGAVGPMDANGIPMADYDLLFKGQPAADPSRHYGIHYTPVTIAQYALGYFGCYLTAPSAEFREGFLRQADWLRDHLAMRGDWGVWLHTFEFPVYGLSAEPWVSAMAQGEGISVLLRAAQLTGDTRYATAAGHAFGAFLRDVREGGVVVRDADGGVWLEEFPTDPPVHVLNGFIFALWGVHEFHRVTGDPRAGRVWADGVATLAKHLHRYELNWWSRYDLRERAACAWHYHATHIHQLQVMAELTGTPVFAACAARWKAYAEGRAGARRFAGRVVRGTLRRLGMLPVEPVRGISAGGT